MAEEKWSVGSARKNKSRSDVFGQSDLLRKSNHREPGPDRVRQTHRFDDQARIVRTRS
jgi:hypothetical protein